MIITHQKSDNASSKSTSWHWLPEMTSWKPWNYEPKDKSEANPVRLFHKWWGSPVYRPRFVHKYLQAHPFIAALHQETQSSKCIESYKRSRWEYFIPEISIPFQTMKTNTHRGKAKSFSWSSWLRVGNGMMGMNDLLEEKGPEVLGWSFNGRQSMPSYFSHLFYLFCCVCAAESLYLEKKMVVGTRFSSFLVLRKGRRRGTVNFLGNQKSLNFFFIFFRKKL